jgi:hypothetical protein
MEKNITYSSVNLSVAFLYLCLYKEGEFDIDDGQRKGDRYGWDVGVVYCEGININKALMENNLAVIYSKLKHMAERYGLKIT